MQCPKRGALSGRSLPVPGPYAAYGMIERGTEQGCCVATIRAAAVILAPCGMVGILVEVLVRNVVVLALHHAAKAGEVAFNPVGVLAVAVAVQFAVVDAAGLEIHVKNVPMGCFIGIDDCIGVNARLGDLHAIGFLWRVFSALNIPYGLWN